MLTRQEIEKQLNTGRQGGILCLDAVTSTNLIAARMVQEGAADGSAVIADSQTDGAGRLGRSFYSPAGVGIYLSYIKELNAEPSPVLGLLTSLAGLAVCDAIAAVCGIWPKIKWPNDIIINEKKVCGILTKLITDSKTNSITHAIIGIGVNVNQNEGDFPEELLNKAGSLRMALGQPVERAKLCAEIINRLDNILIVQNALLSPAAPYIDRLRVLSCTIGKKIAVSSPEGKETGLALDIAPDGGLVVETLTEVKVIRSGEIL